MVDVAPLVADLCGGKPCGEAAELCHRTRREEGDAPRFVDEERLSALDDGGQSLVKVLHGIVRGRDGDTAVLCRVAPQLRRILYGGEILREMAHHAVVRGDKIGARAVDAAPAALHLDECRAVNEGAVVVVFDRDDHRARLVDVAALHILIVEHERVIDELACCAGGDGEHRAEEVR